MMDKQTFERNLLALAKSDPVLCSKLSSALTTTGVYRFLQTRSGELIPALSNVQGSSLPLHSIVDPLREGDRLISTLNEEGCLIFLGLGGAFAAKAALKREATKKIIIIEYDCNGLAELLSSKSYIDILSDSRFRFLLDPGPEQIISHILENYRPAIDGGIRLLPLRTRTDTDKRFIEAAEAVKQAIDAVSRDYSVQAYFGKRWFSNIIRNLTLAEKQCISIPSVKRAFVFAAGPSLEEQIPGIKKELAARKQQTELYLIACDTAFPILLQSGIEPDAVISIDCQHIGYQHFFGILPEKTNLVLDLGSPPLIASRSSNRIFFSGGHPLSQYISRVWRSLPVLDTSGANVCYAALSLAENLGAKEVSLYGADFSYPLGKTYARGAYIYSYFNKFQSRYTPLEALHSAFLYRDTSLQKHFTGTEQEHWYYQTRSLNFYKEKADQKILHIRNAASRPLSFFSAGPVTQSAFDFLKHYRTSLEQLSSFDPLLNQKQNELLTSLLPMAAYIRRTNPLLSSRELFEFVKSTILSELDMIIQS